MGKQKEGWRLLNPPLKLTKREQKVYDLRTNGKKFKQIGVELGISPYSAGATYYRAKQKLEDLNEFTE